MKKTHFYIFSILISSLIMFILFFKIFFAKSLIFPFALYPFDICVEYPKVWRLIKISYIISFYIVAFIFTRIIYFRIPQKNEKNVEEENNVEE